MKIKPYYIEVETLDEYLDVCKHLRYYRHLCGADQDVNVWYITEYNLKPEDLNRKKIMDKLFKRRPDIIKAMKYKRNTICRIHGEIGIFRGIQLTDEDYYWILERADGSKAYCTCVDACQFLSAWNKFYPGDLKPYDRVFIFDHEQQRHRGQIVKREGCLFFQDHRGMCKPMSDIRFWMYDKPIKHKQHDKVVTKEVSQE